MRQGTLFPEAVEAADEPKVIYRASIRLRNGKVIYAHQFGLKGFPIRVRR